MEAPNPQSWSNFEPYKERFGCVAVLDALGFAGISKHVPPTYVADYFLGLKDELELVRKENEARNSDIALGISLKQHHLFASDTVIIASSVTVPLNWNRLLVEVVSIELALWMTSWTVRFAIGTSYSKRTPVAFRGAVSVGTFDMDEAIFAGRAVREAFDDSEKWDGAFVCLCPGTRERLLQLSEIANDPHWIPDPENGIVSAPPFGTFRRHYTQDYSVPLSPRKNTSGGKDVEVADVVNPFFPKQGASGIDDSTFSSYKENLERTFDLEDKDAARKWEHTLRLLKTARHTGAKL